MTQNCGICGSFLPKPVVGDRSRVCGKCSTEHEIPVTLPDDIKIESRAGRFQAYSSSGAYVGRWEGYSTQREAEDDVLLRYGSERS